MIKKTKYIVYLLMLFVSNALFSQLINVQVIDNKYIKVTGSDTATYTYTTYINSEQLYQFEAKGLEGGIMGDTINIPTIPGSFIDMEAYYVGAINRILIYKKTLRNGSSNEYSGLHNQQLVYNYIDKNGNMPVRSDNIKVLLYPVVDAMLSGDAFHNATLYCSMHFPEYLSKFQTFLWSTIILSPYAHESGINACMEEYKNRVRKIPVQVVIKIRNAIFKNFKIPGQISFPNIALGVSPQNSHFGIKVKINGTYKGTYTDENLNTGILSAELGDKIEFIPILNDNLISTSFSPPRFKGIPFTWQARTGGESKYYCTPSINPGDIKPWIGFESQVHGTVLRPYPENYQVQFPYFDTTGGKYNSWSINAYREMKSDSTNYTPVYQWAKQKTIPVIQRNNQKEGLNMQLLRAYSSASSGYKRGYKGIPYIPGSDPDELLYINTRQSNTDSFPSPYKLFKINSDQEEWKNVPWYESADPVNDIVKEYIKYQKARIQDYSVTDDYDSYEIQDEGTNGATPWGKGKVRPAPGKISVYWENRTVNIPINVKHKLPEDNDSGMYRRIQGTRWPSWDGRDKYSIKLKGLSKDELNKVSMILKRENSVGQVESRYYSLANTTSAYRDSISLGQKSWEQSIQMYGNGITDLTVFYKRSPTDDSVILAGKEIKTITLRFLTVPAKVNGVTPTRADLVHLNEINDGGYIYLEEMRNNKETDPEYMPRYGRFAKKYTRTYVIPENKALQFYCQDSDPFTFYNTGTEWYLSSRYQAMRLPLFGAVESQEAAIRYYYAPLNQDGSENGPWIYFANGASPIVKFRKGNWGFKAVYKGAENLAIYHKIIVIDSTNSDISTIYRRTLTDNEASILGISKDSLTVLELKDILSEYAYVTGPRNQTPTNRFGPYNDFRNVHKWKYGLAGQEPQGNLSNIASVQNKVNAYFQSSEISWFPKLWWRHYSDKTLPHGVSESNVSNTILYYTSLFDDIFKKYVPEEPWQLRIPWAAVVGKNPEGVRIRTNIKVIYDMNEFFHKTSGAFTGNPKRISPSDVYLNLMNDRQADEKELMYDIIYGKKIILHNSSFPISTVSVYNDSATSVSTKASTTGILIARKKFDEESSLLRSAVFSTTSFEDTTVLKIYPNPTQGVVEITIPKAMTRTINMCKVSLVNAATNAVVLNQSSYSFSLETGNFFIDMNSLGISTGLYFLTVIPDGSPDKYQTSIYKQ